MYIDENYTGRMYILGSHDKSRSFQIYDADTKDPIMNITRVSLCLKRDGISTEVEYVKRLTDKSWISFETDGWNLRFRTLQLDSAPLICIQDDVSEEIEKFMTKTNASIL